MSIFSLCSLTRKERRTSMSSSLIRATLATMLLPTSWNASLWPVELLLRQFFSLVIGSWPVQLYLRSRNMGCEMWDHGV